MKITYLYYIYIYIYIYKRILTYKYYINTVFLIPCLISLSPIRIQFYDTSITSSNDLNSLQNDEMLQNVKEERNTLHTIKRRKSNWISHILCSNCLLKHIIEGKI